MFISDFAIKRPLVTVVAMVALVVFGLFAFWRLQTDEFPDVQQPIVVTSIIYPGASPEQVEREIEHYQRRGAAERESQQMPDDKTADAARMGARDVVPLS